MGLALLGGHDELVDPLDAPGACHAGHETAQRRAVVRGQRLAVHLEGQEHVAAGVLRPGQRDTGTSKGTSSMAFDSAERP